jgi:hypothetical protein
MRKLLFVLLVASLTVLLAACGSSIRGNRRYGCARNHYDGHESFPSHARQYHDPIYRYQ